MGTRNLTIVVLDHEYSTPLVPRDRFFQMPGLEKTDGYEPIKLAKRYKFEGLPSVAKMSRDVQDRE